MWRLSGNFVRGKGKYRKCDIKCDELEVTNCDIKCDELEVTNCDFKFSNSLLVSWNIKSVGKRSIFRFTA